MQPRSKVCVTHSCHLLSQGMRVKNNLSETSAGFSLGEEPVVFVSVSGDVFWLSLGEDLAIGMLKTKYFSPLYGIKVEILSW